MRGWVLKGTHQGRRRAFARLQLDTFARFLMHIATKLYKMPKFHRFVTPEEIPTGNNIGFIMYAAQEKASH
jgi:hypothetical protein